MVQIIVMQLVCFSSYENADNLAVPLSGYISADQDMICGDWDETAFDPCQEERPRGLEGFDRWQISLYTMTYYLYLVGNDEL